MKKKAPGLLEFQNITTPFVRLALKTEINGLTEQKDANVHTGQQRRLNCANKIRVNQVDKR